MLHRPWPMLPGCPPFQLYAMNVHASGKGWQRKCTQPYREMVVYKLAEKATPRPDASGGTLPNPLFMRRPRCILHGNRFQIKKRLQRMSTSGTVSSAGEGRLYAPPEYLYGSITLARQFFPHENMMSSNRYSSVENDTRASSKPCFQPAAFRSRVSLN